MNSTYRFAFAWLGGPSLVQDVYVMITGDRISTVSTTPLPDAVPIDGVAIPGMVSAHSHAFHRALRGSTHDEGGDFWAWRQPMYRLASELTPDSYHELAVKVFREMVQAGYTTVGEFHYLHHQPDGTSYEDSNAMGHALIAAADEAGIRITLLDTLYLTSGIDGSPPLSEQVRFSDSTSAAWAQRVSLIEAGGNSKVGVAAHSVRAVPAPDLTLVAELSESLGAPLHVHVSEQPAENEASLSEHGMTPVRLLAERGMLGDRTTLVHATHVDSEDRRLIAATNSIVCLCPSTEADLGDGIGPARELADLGVRLCLGSDSNAVVDPFLEMRHLEYHDRLRLGRRGVHSPGSLLNAASRNGAISLGWDAGRIEEGLLADLVVLRSTDGEPSSPGAVAIATTSRSVTHVMVGGKMVLP